MQGLQEVPAIRRHGVYKWVTVLVSGMPAVTLPADEVGPSAPAIQPHVGNTRAAEGCSR